MTGNRNRTVRPTVENLEERSLMSAHLVASLKHHHAVAHHTAHHPKQHGGIRIFTPTTTSAAPTPPAAPAAPVQTRSFVSDLFSNLFGGGGGDDGGVDLGPVYQNTLHLTNNTGLTHNFRIAWEDPNGNYFHADFFGVAPGQTVAANLNDGYIRASGGDYWARVRLLDSAGNEIAGGTQWGSLSYAGLHGSAYDNQSGNLYTRDYYFTLLT